MLESLETRRLLNATLDGSNNLTINGSGSSDTISVTRSGNDLTVEIQPENFIQTFSNVNRVTVFAGAGDDLITFASDVPNDVTFNGEDGADTMVGGAGDDLMFGGNDDDSLDGGLGGDTMIGEDGFDTLTYASRTAAISAFMDGVSNDGEPGEGDNVDATCDLILGGSGNDRISAFGLNGSRFFYGLGGNDTLVGGLDDDRLNGGQGNDDLRGFDGNDILLGTAGRDIFNGGDGIDTVSYYNATSAVTAEPNGRSLSGTAREQDNIKEDVENIDGSDFNDSLTGSAADNILNGRDGQDTLTGLAGSDTLLGGLGNDALFAADGEADTLDGGDGTDTADIDDLLDSVSNVP